MKLLIVEDHPMVSAGLKSMLESHYPQAHIIVHNTFSQDDILATDSDFIFLDMHLPQHTFSEMLDALNAHVQHIILISAYPEPHLVELARQRGVRGLFHKTNDTSLIIETFQRIQNGENVFMDEDGTDGAKIKLTNRQIVIIEDVLKGLSNKQIARKFNISENTVKEHVSAILIAYGARNRLDLLLKNSPHQ
jgi:DNA-binding NarL/FixJ family response regulator